MMSAAFSLHAIAQLSTLRIVDCLVEGTLITFFAGLVLRAARLRNSSARFAVWFSALLALAALPLLGAAAWSHARIPAQSLNRSAITLPGYWAIYLFGAWAAIGFSATVLYRVNTMVLMPIPRARIKTAIAKKPGERNRMRMA